MRWRLERGMTDKIHMGVYSLKKGQCWSHEGEGTLSKWSGEKRCSEVNHEGSISKGWREEIQGAAKQIGHKCPEGYKGNQDQVESQRLTEERTSGRIHACVMLERLRISFPSCARTSVMNSAYISLFALTLFLWGQHYYFCSTDAKQGTERPLNRATSGSYFHSKACMTMGGWYFYQSPGT